MSMLCGNSSSVRHYSKLMIIKVDGVLFYDWYSFAHVGALCNLCVCLRKWMWWQAFRIFVCLFIILNECSSDGPVVIAYILYMWNECLLRKFYYYFKVLIKYTDNDWMATHWRGLLRFSYAYICSKRESILQSSRYHL